MSYIFCCGMSRSASTLQYELIKEVVERKQLGLGFGFHYAHSRYNEEQISIIKTEKSDPWMLSELRSGNAHAVSIYRNPLDVAVSLHHFFHSRHLFNPFKYRDWTQQQTIDEWLPRTMNWYTTWESVQHFQLRYEDTHPDAWPSALEQMCNHLSISITPEESISICNKFSLTRNLERIDKQEEWLNNKSMLTKEHISPRRGAPGQYREHLTPAQMAHIRTVYRAWMITHNYITKL